MKGISKVKQKKELSSVEEFISVIIPFRNESDNILKNLSSIVQQNYPHNKYEVIYVNDNSSDDSYKKIIEAEKPENIKILSVTDNCSNSCGKINAVNYGIENSVGSIIITSDCDCVYDKNWLKTMSDTFSKETGFVSGPVEYFEGDTLFGKMQRLEFAGLVLVGAGLIGIEKPTLCNSANIAFRKCVYEENRSAFSEKNSSSSEDEYMMINIHNNKKYKIKFCWDKSAIVKTKANNSIKKFLEQRKRWASKDWRKYDTFVFVNILLIYLFYLSLLVQLVFSLFFSKIFFYPFIISLMIKTLMEYFVLIKGNDFFCKGRILGLLLVSQVFHFPYILISGISGLFGKFEWKNRILSR